MLSRGSEDAVAAERSSRALLLGWSLPLFAAFWFSASRLSDYLGVPQHADAFRIAAFNIPAMALFYAYEGILKGRRRVGARSGVQMLQSLAKLCGVLALLVIGLSVFSAYVAHVIATVVSVIVALLWFPLRGPGVSTRTAWRIVQSALPLTAYSIALVILMNLSLWQLQHSGVGGDMDTGRYVAGMNLTKILMVIPATTSGVLFVSLSWALANARQDLVAKYIHEAGRFALITLVPVCVVLAVDAAAVMRLLFGADYAAGGVLLGWLCAAFGAVAFLDIYFFVLMARGLTGRAVAVAVGLIPVLYCTNALWIPRFGVLGAAMASTVVLSLGALVFSAMVRAEFGYLLPWRTILRVGIGGSLVGLLAAVWPAGGITLIAKVAALGMVYLASLFLLRELKVHDLRPFLLWQDERKSGN
jgi:stage V sporulation protein B